MADFGCLKVILHQANLFPPLINEEIKHTRIELILTNSSLIQRNNNSKILKIIRNSDEVSGLSPQWNDYIELRCSLGWDMKINIIITFQNNQIKYYEVDNLIIGTCTSGNYYIRQSDNKKIVCGEINISLDFFPNHQSLRQLIIDCCSEKGSDPKTHINSLPSLLLNELSDMINKQIQELLEDNEYSSISSSSTLSSSWVQLLAACQKLNSCANTSLDELSEQLYEQHFASSIITASNTNTNTSSTSSSLSPKFSSNSRRLQSKDDLNSPRLPPQSIEEYRVAATARSFLLSLIQDLPRFIAPLPTIQLIEKQLLIFHSSIPSTISTTRHSINNSPSSSRHMLWNDVLRFILLISIWFLQHSFISLSLSHEYHITPRELSAIRNSFERYDKDLSGDIPSTDLKYLLQDMGENYSDKEISLLLSLVDSDGLDVIEFPEFIRWWCDDTGEVEGLDAHDIEN